MIVASAYVPGAGGASLNAPAFVVRIVVAPAADVNVSSALGTGSPVDQLITCPAITPPSAAIGSSTTRPWPGFGSSLASASPAEPIAGSTTILPRAEPLPPPRTAVVFGSLLSR